MRFPLCLLLLSASLCWPQTAGNVALHASVDPRVELLSIVFRLAGNEEYNMNRITKYSLEIDRYFAPYKTHPAVQLARRLAADRQIGADAVMFMALYLSAPPDLQPVVLFDESIPEPRWGAIAANQFALQVRRFYNDSKFQIFFDQHRQFYRQAEGRFDSVLTNADVSWLGRFYGATALPPFHVVLGLNNGAASYGPRVNFPDGRTEFYAIVGAESQDPSGNPTFNNAYVPLISHEFSHSFINPLVDRIFSTLQPLDELFRSAATQFEPQGIAGAKVMLYESLVRAAVFRYQKSHGISDKEVLAKIHREQGNGFVWMEELFDLLGHYEADREIYPAFDDFLPKIAQYFNTLEPRLVDLRGNFERNVAHVISVDPIGSHATDVDPAIQELVIHFDRPLDPSRGFSFRAGNGDDHFPIVGDPLFLPGNQGLKIKVKLRPNWDYQFTLTPRAFMTPEGYPLKSNTVEFQTK